MTPNTVAVVADYSCCVESLCAKSAQAIGRAKANSNLLKFTDFGIDNAHKGGGNNSNLSTTSNDIVNRYPDESPSR